MKRFIAFLNALVLLLGALACNYNQNKDLDKGLEGLAKLINDSQLDQKENLKKEVKGMIKSQRNNFTKIQADEQLSGKFDNSDTTKAVQWIKTNEATINSVMARMQAGIEKEIADINAISKAAYEEQDLEAASFKYALVYYRLQYFRNNISTIIENLSPLSVIIHSHALVDDTETLEFRKNLEKDLLKLVGIGLVVDQDIVKIKDQIKLLNEVQPLDVDLKNNLVGMQNKIAANAVEKSKRFGVDKSVCKDESKREECQKREEIRAEIMKEFSNVTFLYTPGQKYFLITKILTLVGNLTWGLANTLIGAGVVLVTMAVSPFTRYVDFPTFRVSASGMQIYVDVTGMSPIPGKMSLGLFELDNAAGYRYASEHEAGHAIQSAILGPFYLPTVLVTYLISGFDVGLMEDLADEAARVSDKWL